MAWRAKGESTCCGLPHKVICPLLRGGNGQGQGDGGVGRVAGGDGNVSEGGRASNRVNPAKKTKLLILASTHLNQLHLVP